MNDQQLFLPNIEFTQHTRFAEEKSGTTRIKKKKSDISTLEQYEMLKQLKFPWKVKNFYKNFEIFIFQSCEIQSCNLKTKCIKINPMQL